MAVLRNARHEQFAQGLAAGLSATGAYVQVYGPSAAANRSASRLLSNVDICERVKELQTTISAGLVQLEISQRSARLTVLQDLVDRGRRLIDARARDMADVPGGSTGLLCRDYRGKNAEREVYKADIALMREIRKGTMQVAQELGEWNQELPPNKQVIIVVPAAKAPSTRRVIDPPPEEPPLDLPGMVIDLAPRR